MDANEHAWKTPPRLAGRHVAIEPLSPAHAGGLRSALGEGELSRCWYTSVPAPGDAAAYIDAALEKQARGGSWAFAVLDDAQGEGLGRAVWQVMREETPRLFWRSRHHNAVNAFYHAEADGCVRQEKWRAFWYGLDGFTAIDQTGPAEDATRLLEDIRAALGG